LREALTDYKYSFAGGGFGAFLIDRWISFKKMNTIFAASNRLPRNLKKQLTGPFFIWRADICLFCLFARQIVT